MLYIKIVPSGAATFILHRLGDTFQFFAAGPSRNVIINNHFLTVAPSSTPFPLEQLANFARAPRSPDYFRPHSLAHDELQLRCDDGHDTLFCPRTASECRQTHRLSLTRKHAFRSHYRHKPRNMNEARSSWVMRSLPENPSLRYVLGVFAYCIQNHDRIASLRGGGHILKQHLCMCTLPDHDQ